ncbi:hypothetical protein IMG5_181390 [Ichthyophthirius multifiliis]|uniref:Citrate synthase n=1 Tax=Ichthyophthirius multifiliis TaxID=5932 RepID=G0R2T8_ICHMU|nr:hypothetical protein IMG5_181390 [Ichthyophthirius multifiliis]EGR28210.1 hypothetical protein IMG5_181390 [Ichthyophthirius multifiliis]|eukprot:XP_004027555.1 hypothetical protein IMG5_181390 [Ichthyophthirius multifiliis]
MERLADLNNQITQNETSEKEYLTVIDNRTGKSYEVAVKQSREGRYIQAKDIGKIKTDTSDVLRVYDPAYMNTIVSTSKISYIDGDKGILEYRGIPIEQLAEKSNFLEVAYLLIFGDLPSKNQYTDWVDNIQNHTIQHTDVQQMMKNFRYDAHPMGMLISTIAALSTFRPESNPALAGQEIYKDLKIRNKQIFRLLGQVPTIAANAYRSRIGRNFNLPSADLPYVDNFFFMMDKLNEVKYKPHPKLSKALDILFILHAEHEMNCSTAFVRHLASSGVDIYSVIAGASGALYGPKHGGANEAVLRMLEEIGDTKNIPSFIEKVKQRKALLFGFGHRVYKNYDPRAKIVKKVAHEVFEIVGKEPLIELAMALEKVALEDEYFIKRKLYPNVDFYSGVIYRAMGFPTDMFAVLFTIPRVAGWIAHWVEYLEDKENNIVRPRQNYSGYPKRNYVPLEQRIETKFELDSPKSSVQKRREAGSSQNN